MSLSTANRFVASSNERQEPEYGPLACPRIAAVLVLGVEVVDDVSCKRCNVQRDSVFRAGLG